MIFRRRPGRSSEDEKTPGAGVTDSTKLEELSQERAHGPWDRSETTVDEASDAYVDLGGLLVPSPAEHEVQLQLDDEAASVLAVLVAGAESAVELRAFAAPRRDGIWADVRRQIASEAAKAGGTATEVDGEFGTEVRLVMPVQAPDGRPATQPSRVVGVDGPRWLLRGTFLGKSAVDPDPEGAVETAFRHTIVVRGDEPMLPREMIPMRLPEQIQLAAGDELPADLDEAGSGDIDPPEGPR